MLSSRSRKLMKKLWLARRSAMDRESLHGVVLMKSFSKSANKHVASQFQRPLRGPLLPIW
jgi:hypothetical protein